MSNSPDGRQIVTASAGAAKADETKKGVKDRAKRKYSPRSNLGFHLLVVHGGKKEGDATSYTETGAPPQKSMGAALKYLKAHAADFKDQKIMIAHLKREVNVAVTTKVVAAIT
ncbi:MAG: hypothetical protein ABFE07_29275 [Armatimonadia bacterium]